MLWNLTSLWSFSSTVWHLFKVQTEPFCFPDLIRSFFQNHCSPFPVSLIHLRGASKRCHRRAALLSPGLGGASWPPWAPSPCPTASGEPFWRQARGRRGPRCGGGRVLTNPGPAVTQASPPVNLPAALTGAWPPFKPLRASRRATLPYEVFHNNNSC